MTSTPQQKKQVEKQAIVQKKVETVDVKQQLDEKKKKLLEIKQKLEKQTDTAKVEALKKESEQVKKELDTFLNTIKQSERKKYQPEIKELKTMQTEIANIIAKSKKELKEVEKGIVEKVWDWVKGDEKEKYHGWMQWLRWTAVAGGVIGWAVAIGAMVGKAFDWISGGVKKTWNWIFGKKKNIESNKEKEFFDTWYGKTLKWVGLWGAATYLIRGFSTGNWDFFWLFGGKSPDAVDDVEDQIKATEKLKEKNPEKFKKYQKLGDNIDIQYNTVMKKELDAWRWWMSIADWYKKYVNKNNMTLDDFKATVPMCVDNEFSSVDSLLSEHWYYSYLRSKKIEDIQGLILWWGEEKIKRFIWPYLSTLTSFIPFKGKNRSDSVKKWMESWTQTDRKNELDFFFRQYVKVMQYAQDKRHILVEKIAEEKYQFLKEDHSTFDDAINDSEWLDKYVYWDERYRNFNGGKLHQAVDVMKAQNIFDASLSKNMEKEKVGADAQRDLILKDSNGKDNLQKFINLNWQLTPELKSSGIDLCNKMSKDIRENFDKDWSYLYFSSFHETINSKNKNIQEFLEKSWLDALKNGMIKDFAEYKNKIENWTITPEEIKEYINLINSYFATKKEILIWAKAIQQMKNDDPNIWEKILNIGMAVVSDLRYHTKKSGEKLWKGEYLSWWLTATAPLLVGGGVITWIGQVKGSKRMQNFWKFIRDANIFSFMWRRQGTAMRHGTRLLGLKNLSNTPFRLLKNRYNIPNGDQLLYQDIIEWKVHGAVTEKLCKLNNPRWKNIGKWQVNSMTEFMQKIAGKTTVDMPDNYLRTLFFNQENIPFTKNKSLRNLFFKQEKIWVWENTKGVWNGYRKKIFNITGMHHVEVLDNFMNWEAWRISKFAKLSENQKNLFKEVILGGEFKDIKNLYHIIENIDKINLDSMTSKQIMILSEQLSKTLDDFSEVYRLEAKFQGILKNISIEDTENLLKKPIFSMIESEIKILKNDLKNTKNTSKVKQIQKQIEQIEYLRKELVKWGESVVDQSTELLKILKGDKSFSHAISQLTILKKLEGQKFVSTIIDPTTNKPLVRNLDDVIKSLDHDAILKLKGNNIAWISDESLDGLVDTFKALKKSRNASKLLSNTDDILKWIKTLVKFLAKAS